MSFLAGYINMVYASDIFNNETSTINLYDNKTDFTIGFTIGFIVGGTIIGLAILSYYICYYMNPSSKRTTNNKYNC